MTALREKLDFTAKKYLHQASRCFVAYSGGMDSHVLLHLSAHNEQLNDKLTAVYVNHGLQAQADAWEKHCQQICVELGVNFMALKVNATHVHGESPEEAARNARYHALRPLLNNNDVLMLAQHAEDQLETVLLQLFRGSGLKGLSGMPENIAFGAGQLIRPLLNISKAEINHYASAYHLKWVADPSNAQNHYDRNFLRNAVIPLLKQRWPSLDTTVARSAKHCAEAQLIVSGLAEDLLQNVLTDSKTIHLSEFNNYTSMQQQLVVRQWFQHLGLKMPSLSVVQRILQEIVIAADDAGPVLVTQQHDIRRYRNELFCIDNSKLRLDKDSVWSVDGSSLKLADDIIYDVVSSGRGIAQECWNNATVMVTFRTGGETIRLPDRHGSHQLKKLFQEVGIPPWERQHLPLIYLNNQLAAVGEFWIAAEFYSERPDACIKLVRRKVVKRQ